MKMLMTALLIVFCSGIAISQPVQLIVEADTEICALDYPAFLLKVSNSGKESVYIYGGNERYEIEYYFVKTGEKKKSKTEMQYDTASRLYSRRLLPNKKYVYGVVDRFFSLAARSCEFNYTGKVRAKITLYYFYKEEWSKISTIVEFNLRQPTAKELDLCERLRMIPSNDDVQSLVSRLSDEYKNERSLVNRSFSIFVSTRIQTHNKLKRPGLTQFDKKWYNFAKQFGSEAYLLSVRETIAHWHYNYREHVQELDIENMQE